MEMEECGVGIAIFCVLIVCGTTIWWQTGTVDKPIVKEMTADEEHSRGIVNEGKQSFEDKFSFVWLNIVRFLSDKDGDLSIICKLPELKGIGELVRAEQHTLTVLTMIERKGSIKGCEIGSSLSTTHPVSRLEANVDRGLRQIEDTNELWDSWVWEERKGCHYGFRSLELFYEFCHCAGVHPSDGFRWYGRKFDENVYRSDKPFDVQRVQNEKQVVIADHYFLSIDKKVIVIARRRRRRCSRVSFGFWNIQIIGQRDRVTRLGNWFHSKASAA